MVAALNVWAAHPAQARIENATDKVLKALRADSSQIYTLVDKVVLPLFDFARMSKLVLGKNWKRANRDQKIRFVKAFRDLLVRTYAMGLVEAAGQIDRIEYSSRARSSKRATVRSKVYQKGIATPIDVNYSMYYYGGKWKVYNVSIGGVSLVTTYRTEFTNDIRTMGMNGLINKLEKKSRKKIK
jgi:phospholipid transport system substrate-binding protein